VAEIPFCCRNGHIPLSRKPPCPGDGRLARASALSLDAGCILNRIFCSPPGVENEFHRWSGLALPDNISLLFLPPYSPELNPKENLCDEIRKKIFKNYALKSIDAVRAKLEQAILYIERKPETVKSITSFPCILKSL
jgi:DDE superfamily endonuclease